MFGSREATVFSGLRRLVFLGAFLVVLFISIASAQKGQTNAPRYDPHTEAKMKGIVEELNLPPKGSEREAAHLLLKDGTANLDVYLCPKSFLDDMGISYSKGDEVALTGSKVKQGDAELILAREVVKGNDTLVLRDEKGNPVWNWHR
jgi:hypothetical protein